MDKCAWPRLVCAWIAAFLCAASPAAEWRPDKPIEIIVGTPPGGPLDATARLLQKLLEIGMSVKVDSPVRDGGDLIARLRANPEALTFAITNRASGNHIAAGTVLKAAGVDLRKVKFVSFRGSAETTTAVLGGHVDVAMATPGSAWKHVQGGKLRMLAVSSPKRIGGEVAVVPTWKELGINAVSSNWRAVVGPKGLTAAQIAYWDQTLAAVVKTPQWREAVQRNQWEDEYLNSAATLKFMQEEYRHLEALLVDLGDAKK